MKKTLPILMCLCLAATVCSANSSDWNLARVVSRGASAVHVASKISNNALVLSIK